MPFSIRVLRAGASLVLASTGCGPAAVSTLQPSPVNPLPLHGEAAAFNEATGSIVLVGGSNAERRILAGTWEWDGRWRQVVDSASSPAFRDGAIGYDAHGRRVILYAIDRFENRQAVHCSTWAYAERRWTLLAQGPCLTTRWRSLGITRAPGQSLVLADGPSLPGDTALRPMRLWSLRGTVWVPIDSAGPRRVGYSRVAYDSRRDRLVAPVLFGGPDTGVWEFDGRTWTKATPAIAPSIRQTYGLAYDAAVGLLMLAGGQGETRGPYYADLWSWNGREWQQRVQGDSVPPGRGGGQFFVDARGGRSIYFSGYNEAALHDLWVLTGGRWVRVDP